jgi:CubicO group peptidase (beta-lactamase class C family)
MIGPDHARQIIDEAVRAGVFPAAAMEVGDSASALWTEARGTLTFDVASPPALVDTPFDLASLTKVIATTTVVMDLVRTGALRLDERVSSFFVDWRGTDRDTVTVQDLLEHASGLSARLLDPPPAARREFEHDIGTMPLEYAPRSRSVYSDLGFILLGFLAVDRGGAPLADLFERVPAIRNFRLPFGPPQSRQADSADGLLTFDIPLDTRRLAAPTRPLEEDTRRGRLLIGDVHDNYAAALGGVAGHAGLFGTTPAVGAFARALLAGARGSRNSPAPFSPELVANFTRKSAVPGSSRALGWDTMLPTSSCGTRMSPQAFGHVGFSGTSLWIDPVRDRYFVLLTNRVCGGGTIEEMRTVRRAFHDALGNV